MNNILNCFKELCDNSTISDLQWDNDLQIIMFNDKRGKWKLIKDFNGYCECGKSSKFKIMLDDFMQGFVCEECIKMEAKKKPKYIFSKHVAYFDSK